MLLISIGYSQVCGDHKWYNQTASSCQECNHNCKTCFSTNKCKECKENFYMDTDYSCKERDQEELKKCGEWDNLFCVLCKPGYYLINQVCTSCSANCSYCNRDRCFQCKQGFTLVKGGEKCVDCKLAENDELCGRCPLDKYFDVKDFTCKPCTGHCSRCANETACYVCEDSYAHLDPNNISSSCEKLEGCSDSHVFGDHCEMCSTGFYLVDGLCKRCSEKCIKCLDNETCIECDSGKTLSTGKCVDLIENCARSSPKQGCLECNEGFYLQEDSTCTKCPDQCLSCLNSTFCFRCAENYYFDQYVEGKCQQMDDHCKVTDQYGCLQCMYDVKDEAACMDEFTNKSYCDSADITYGYYLPASRTEGDKIVYNKRCEKCSSNCKICDYNSTWCSACNDGYALALDSEATKLMRELTGDSSVSAYVCNKKPDSCKKTEMGYCVECTEKYFLIDVNCTRCNESCGTCTNSDFCQTCNSELDENGAVMYWRPTSLSSKDGIEKGHCLKVSDSLEDPDYNLNQCKVPITVTGCGQCNNRYFLNDSSCHPCPLECSTCKFHDDSSDVLDCSSCGNGSFLNETTNVNGTYMTCLSCSAIDKCVKCDSGGCSQCEGSYSTTEDRKRCKKVNLALILPLSIAGGFILILILILVIIIIWRRRKTQEKQREKEIRPFKVSSDVELALLSADNAKFPLKTERWELNFNLSAQKAEVDKEYTQTLKIANTSKKSYYFEILNNPSHRYVLEVDPVRQTLKAGYAIELTFKIKMLCTAIVNEDIGIVAMDINDNNKETAKIKIKIESDLSMKLDHQDLKPINPPIGEGAFGMVFRGTYRGQDVAIKKMKSRNLTEEQEKEFNHEVQMLTQLRHQCVVNLIGAVYTEGEIAIVTEFAEFGSMSRLWGKQQVSYDLKIKMLYDLAVALQFLHQNQMIHRDVKGENVLIYSLNPHSSVCGKLTDFGTCRNICERSLQTKALSTGVGTPTYMSPESLQGTGNYSFPVDVYAYAVVLYETFNEKQAYVEEERFSQPWTIPQFVIEGNRLDRNPNMSDDYWNLIVACWDQDPEKRPTFTQILGTLQSWNCSINHGGGDAGPKVEVSGGDASVSQPVNNVQPEAPVEQPQEDEVPAKPEVQEAEE